MCILHTSKLPIYQMQCAIYFCVLDTGSYSVSEAYKLAR